MNSTKHVQETISASLCMEVPELSRDDIVSELKIAGVSGEAVAPLSTSALASLLKGVRKLIDSDEQRRPGRPKGTIQQTTDLTPLDKKVILALLRSQGNVTSRSLGDELSAPMSTVTRRRQRLEENLIDRSCTLKADKFGWGNAVVLVSVNSRPLESVAEEILMDDMVNQVTHMVSSGNMDLKVDVLFKSRQELQSMLERIKSVDGVESVVWSEPVRVLGKNNRCYEKMLDSV